MVSLLCLLLLLLYASYRRFSVAGGIPDNRGTEFVIGYMANDDTDNELQLFVTTSKTTSVSVQVTAPRYSASRRILLISVYGIVSFNFKVRYTLSKEYAALDHLKGPHSIYAFCFLYAHAKFQCEVNFVQNFKIIKKMCLTSSTLTFCILLDIPSHIDTISKGLPTMYLEGSQVGFLNYDIFLSLKVSLILANSAYPDEMQHYAALHLGLQCLPKYPFRGFQYTKG